MKIDMIFGPPGTGKSTRLLDILNKELETVAPDQIAYVSFTKEGANIGKTRAKQRFGLTDEDFPFFRTLHSLAFNELNMRRTSMMAPSHYKHFSHKMGMSFVGYYTEEFTNNDDRYLFFDSLHRNNPRTAAQYASTINTDKLAHVRRNYRRYKDTFALYD
jgi:superfamily I DNA/RNA helicase